MRFLFLLIFLAGGGMAAYPWLSANMLEHEVGKWRVYDAAGGYVPAQPRLKEADAPLKIMVDLATTGIGKLPPDSAILTLTASVNGKTVLAKAMTFADATATDTNPQMQARVYRASAGVIDPVEDGAYLFTVGKGDAETVPVQSVDLILATAGPLPGSRVQPLGFAAMAIGFIGLVLAFRGGRGGQPENPNSQPPPPRWGRGGSVS